MVRTSLRLDDKLYDQLLKVAKKHRRSTNNMICYIIEKYIENELWKMKNTLN